MFYFQHVGEHLFQRDAPKSLGTPAKPRTFSLDAARDEKVFRETPSGVQIWGLPFGAETAVRRLEIGAQLMLLAHDNFEYVGKVVYRFPNLQPDLSMKMWGETKFSIIVALKGAFIDYPWDAFLEEFGYAPNFQLRGKTTRLTEDRISSAGYRDSDHVASNIIEKHSVL